MVNPKKRSPFFLICSLLITACFVFISCKQPDGDNDKKEEGSITISFSRSNGRAIMPWPPDDPENYILNEIDFEITLTNNGDIRHLKSRGEAAINAIVPAGRWNVEVNAFYKNEPYATGSNYVDVIAGQSNTVRITMNKAFITLPERWMGIWECWTQDDDLFLGNTHFPSQWRTSQDGHMILTPGSINFWYDLESRIAELDEDIASKKEAGEDSFPWDTWEEYREFYIEVWPPSMSSFSFLEVTANGDGTYDVLISSITEWDDTMYRKLRFQEGTGVYAGELWIIF